MVRKVIVWLGSVVLGFAGGLGLPSAVVAQAPSEGYAQLTIDGAAGDYSGTRAGLLAAAGAALAAIGVVTLAVVGRRRLG